MSSIQPFRVYLVDDHPIVRAGLASLIDGEEDLVVCGQTEEAGTALREIEETAPDLVLVDLSLKGTSGLELLKQLEQRSVATLVVSMLDDPIWAERSLAAGALGYVHKSEATEHVVEAIRKVRDGRPWVSESIAEELLLRRVGPPDRRGQGSTTDLSDRELEVFVRIGRGMTTREIGAELHLSPKTVQTYRQRIKEKLGLKTAAELSMRATLWAAG